VSISRVSKKSRTLKQLFTSRSVVVSKRWMSTGGESLKEHSRQSREEQLEEELAINHPEVLALSKIQQHKPSRALEVLKKPLDELRALKNSLSEDQTLRLHHLLGLRMMALMEMGEVREAMFAADEQMALMPNNAVGISNRGLVQASAGDHHSAASSQREAIALASSTNVPKSPYLDAHYRLAVALRNLSDLQGALDALEVVLDHNPAHYDTLILRASIHLEMGRIEVARETFLEAIRMDGTRPEAYAELGNLFYGSGSYQHATTFLKEALKRDPQNVDALVYMGNVLVMTHYPQEAMTTYDSALLVDPRSIKTLLSKAALLGRLKRYDDAIRTADQVIGRNSNIPQAYLTKGEAYEQLGKQEDAVQAFERALDIDVKFSKAYVALFKLLHKMARLEQLEEVATRASQVVPDFGEAFFYAALTQTITRRWKEARINYEKALQINPTSTQIILSLASCLTHLGEFDAAFALLEKSDKLDRKSLSYNYTLAILLQSSGRLDEAIEALNRAINADPQSHVCLQMRASLLHRLGRFDDAHDAFDKLIKLSPNPGRFYIHKGHVYASQRNYLHAIDSFDTAVEIDALLRPLGLQSKINPLIALGRKEEAELAKQELLKLSVKNPENLKEAQPELQYRPLQQTREESSEEDDMNALKDAMESLKSSNKL